MNQKIEYINVDNIFPHPKNPRKELGDLTELTESIKVNGIFQNLTVVPFNEKYTVIIGHRRLAAAKLAGLESVPCIVMDMDEKKQLSTMLLENIQRSDLTIYEQAQGFQMMFDLGESVKSISEKTGLSESTIRKRTSLLALDDNKLRDATNRGATLQDLYELNSIEDVNLRNKVLESTGTANFRAALNNAKDREIINKNKPFVIEQLQRFAVQIDYADVVGKAWVDSYYLKEAQDFIKIPDDAGHINYYYTEKNYYIYLYKDKIKTFEELRRELMAERLRASRDILEEMSMNALRLRIDFMKRYVGRQNDLQTFVDVFAKEVCNNFDCIDLEGAVLKRLFDIGEDSDWQSILRDAYEENPVKTFGCFAYVILEMPNERYYNNNLEVEPSVHLDAVYDFLQKLGYELSDEELSLKNGTHVLLKRG